ncbi:hypothetical protein [Streptomyces erythrochromogenes]|uniref:hypothetical protein n=1 Tax=Streptomyces erythrochromogenes TaxID=285574 RepID=UPI0037D199C1
MGTLITFEAADNALAVGFTASALTGDGRQPVILPVTFFVAPQWGLRSSGPAWLPPVLLMIRGVVSPGSKASTDR